MAIETGTKLVPVTIIDNWSILPDDGKFRISWKRQSRLVIHEPVNTEGYSIEDLQALQSSVYNTIQSELHRRNRS